jgi:hypothetical protein
MIVKSKIKQTVLLKSRKDNINVIIITIAIMNKFKLQILNIIS